MADRSLSFSSCVGFIPHRSSVRAGPEGLVKGKGADSSQEDKTSLPHTCDLGNKNWELEYLLTYCTDGFGFVTFLFVLFLSF